MLISGTVDTGTEITERSHYCRPSCVLMIFCSLFVYVQVLRSLRLPDRVELAHRKPQAVWSSHLRSASSRAARDGL